MAFGKTVRVFLADGSATGLKHAEITNWTGQAVACPRARLPELKNWEESGRPGAYFLIAAGNPPDEGIVYVGESENVQRRLLDQERQREFWTEVVLVTSKDENLTKAHVRFLEARLLQMVRQAARAEVSNSTQPPLPPLPRPDRDAMEEFLQNVRTVLGTLGHRFLEPIQVRPGALSTGTESPGTRAEPTVLEFRFKGLKATGALSDEGFVVFEGSDATAETTPSTPANAVRLRERLEEDGILVPNGADKRLAKDWLFNSPSEAACFVSGSSRSGWESWKSGDKTLKDLEAEAAGLDGTKTESAEATESSTKPAPVSPVARGQEPTGRGGLGASDDGSSA